MTESGIGQEESVGPEAGPNPASRVPRPEPSIPDSRLPTPAFRVGIGYDSHRFAPGGPMILAGCRIPSDVSLVGHSDGDAVSHAVTDAVLGAAGAGDIGEMFSDSDAGNRGRDSLEMLRLAVERVSALGWAVHNVDVTVVTEQPRIGRHREAMRTSLANTLAVDISCVNIKGKTNEGMGWVGRGEGLACMAVACLAPVSRRENR